MSDTTPLRRDERIGLTNTDTSDLKKHYTTNAAGYYANHQYADISLILRRNYNLT